VGRWRWLGFRATCAGAIDLARPAGLSVAAPSRRASLDQSRAPPADGEPGSLEPLGNDIVDPAIGRQARGREAGRGKPSPNLT
jgi:hypothetical protein